MLMRLQLVTMLDFRIRTSTFLRDPDNKKGLGLIHYRTKHCWQNYVDYHKCVIAKGEDFKPCRQVRDQLGHGETWYLCACSSTSPIDHYVRTAG